MKTLDYVRYARLEIDLIAQRMGPLDEVVGVLFAELVQMAKYDRYMRETGKSWGEHRGGWPPFIRLAELLVPDLDHRRAALAELEQISGRELFVELQKQFGFLRDYAVAVQDVQDVRDADEFEAFFASAAERATRDATEKRLNHEEYTLGWARWFKTNVSNNFISKTAAYGDDMSLVGGLRKSWDLVARCAKGDSPAFPVLFIHAAERGIYIDDQIIAELSNIGSHFDITEEVDYRDEALFEAATAHFWGLVGLVITTDKQEWFLHFGLKSLDRILAGTDDIDALALEIEQEWWEQMEHQGPDLLAICELSTRFDMFRDYLKRENIRGAFLNQMNNVALGAFARVCVYFEEMAMKHEEYSTDQSTDEYYMDQIIGVATRLQADATLANAINQIMMGTKDPSERDLALARLPLKGAVREDLLKVSSYQNQFDVFRDGNGLGMRSYADSILQLSRMIRDFQYGYVYNEIIKASEAVDLGMLEKLKAWLEVFNVSGAVGRDDMARLSEEWPFVRKNQKYLRFLYDVALAEDPRFVLDKFTAPLLSDVQVEIDTLTVMAPFFPALADAVDRIIARGENAEITGMLTKLDLNLELLGEESDAYLEQLSELWADETTIAPGDFHPGQMFRELFQPEMSYVRERLATAAPFGDLLESLELEIEGTIKGEDSFLSKQMGGIEQQKGNFQSWIRGHEAYARMITWMGTMARQDITRPVDFVGLTLHAFGQDTGSDETLARFLRDEWLPRLKGLSSYELAQSRLDAAGFRARLRFQCADAIGKWKKNSIGLFDERFDTAAMMAAIGLLVDEIHETIAPTEFSTEWQSLNIHRWADRFPPTRLQKEREKFQSYLSALRNSWLVEGRESFREVLNEMADPNCKETLGLCLNFLVEAPEYIQYYFVEQIGPLLDLLDVDTGKRQETKAFLDVYQIDFHLRNEFGHEMLSSLTRQEMELELINRSSDTLTLREPQLPPGVSDPAMSCHFVLRFKAGVLTDSLDNIRLLGPSDKWVLVGRVHRPAEMPLYDELYIRGPQDDAIPAGHARYLTLQEMRGQDFGDRTTQILLLYQGLSHGSNPSLRGHREKRLSVVNALPSDGKNTANLPIVTQFVGPNSVMNDGVSQSKLNIAVTSVAPADRRAKVEFRTFSHRPATAKSPAHTVWSRSKIIMWLDTKDVRAGEEKDWALCTKSQAAGITATLTNATAGNTWDVAFMGQGARAEWVFTPPRNAAPEDQVLARGKSLSLTLSNIHSSLHAGPANIYLRFEDFPGYPDRDYVLEVQKSRLKEREGVDSGGLFDRPRDVDIEISGGLEVSGSATVDGVTHATLPAGAIIVWAGFERDVPDGWLICDGSLVPNEQKYQKLRRVLVGSDVNWEFVNTPDLVGRTVIGAMDNKSYDRLQREDAISNDTGNYVGWPADTYVDYGHKGGQWTHHLTGNEMPIHEHRLNGGDFGTSYNYDLKLGSDPDNFVTLFHQNMDRHKPPNQYYLSNTDYSGGSQRHSNVQPYLALFHLIKY
jgi:microcystin-dependent protein